MDPQITPSLDFFSISLPVTFLSDVQSQAPEIGRFTVPTDIVIK